MTARQGWGGMGQTNLNGLCWTGLGAIIFGIAFTFQGLAVHADTFGTDAYAKRDYTHAATLFIRRAYEGQPTAQTYLGYMYANGQGVPQDFVAAARWLRRAADQGYPSAQFLLGLMYDKGHGVKRDFVQAEVWLNLATSRAEDKQRDYWTLMRDAVAGKLTLDELAEAQERASEWEHHRSR